VLISGVRLTKLGFLIIVILFANFFTWYYVVSIVVLEHVVGSSIETYQVAYIFFNLIIAFTLLLSSIYIHKFNTIRIIYGCSVTISVLAPLLFVPNMILRLMVIFTQGVFLGVGQLASFMYFWSITVSEERGRTVGIIGFFFLPFFQVVSLMVQTFDFFWVVMLTIILSSGILTIRLLRPEKTALLTRKKGEQGYCHDKRTILLYSIPWVLFSLVNVTLARNISVDVFQSIPSSFYTFLVVLQMIACGFGALGGGIIADFFGRRLSLGLSLTLYGLSTALGGFFQNYGVLFFMYIANGLSWGILWTLYGSVVWSDLSDKKKLCKICSIGLVTFYGVTGFGFLFTPQISQISLVTSSLLSCVLIFISNIPLILAPELLSSDFREKIKLKLHMNVVRKLRKQSQDQG